MVYIITVFQDKSSSLIASEYYVIVRCFAIKIFFSKKRHIDCFVQFLCRCRQVINVWSMIECLAWKQEI